MLKQSAEASQLRSKRSSGSLLVHGPPRLGTVLGHALVAWDPVLSQSSGCPIRYAADAEVAPAFLRGTPCIDIRSHMADTPDKYIQCDGHLKGCGRQLHGASPAARFALRTTQSLARRRCMRRTYSLGHGPSRRDSPCMHILLDACRGLRTPQARCRVFGGVLPSTRQCIDHRRAYLLSLFPSSLRSCKSWAPLL